MLFRSPLPASDVGALIADPAWRERTEETVRTAPASAVVQVSGLQLAPLLPRAGKVICCGLNYGDHIQEMGRELPEYPTLFAKFADTLTGPLDELEVHGSDADSATGDCGEPRHLGFQTGESGIGCGSRRRRAALGLRSDGRARRYGDDEAGRDDRG